MTLPRPKSTVICRDLHEGAILFCTATEIYFSLNPVAVRIWKLLPPECVSEDEVVARLSELHPDVNPGTIAADVRALLQDLASHGLVEITRAA